MMVSQQNQQDAIVLWNYHNISKKLSSINNSIIIGFGSYDLRVAEHCAMLFNLGTNNRIIFTGKNGNWTTDLWGQDCIEAELFAKHVEVLVSKENIILEKEARNLGENILFSKKIIDTLDLKFEKIILVTKPNTTRRAYATTLALCPDLEGNLHISSPDYDLDNISPVISENNIISELVGDIERIIAYPQKGFQISQEAPAEVIDAYLRLKKHGYTEHCL
jgi:uncharacterized SAM-binding protein YcdF (DUF218 family)